MRVGQESAEAIVARKSAKADRAKGRRIRYEARRGTEASTERDLEFWAVTTAVAIPETESGRSVGNAVSRD